MRPAGHPLAELWGRALLDTASNVVLEHLDRWSDPMRNGSRLLLAAAAAVLVVPFTFVVLNLLQYGLHLSIPWNPHELLWPQVRFTVWRYLYDAVIVLSAPARPGPALRPPVAAALAASGGRAGLGGDS